jgi:CBS domain-containing protein
MTSPAISIREAASLDDFTDLMETNTVRRVPVVAAAGAIVGIVAQADIARCASRKEAGELVRDVSTPR